MFSFSPSTSDERKELFIEILLNKTSKINKISNESVLNGVAYGIGKVSGKAEKDIFQALSKLLPDYAYGQYLDQCAAHRGVSARFLSSQSTTYVRVVGDPGTTYNSGSNFFISTNGVVFNIENSITIGDNRFAYVKVRSNDFGLKTNVGSNTITKITPTPSGHKYCTNEYQALGGRDNESDDLFRKRIKDSQNLLAKNTREALKQAFIKINNNILDIRYQGIDEKGKVKIAIITQNGITLSSQELNIILQKGEEFLPFTLQRQFGQKTYGISLVNIGEQYIDISFRCELEQSVDINSIRVEIQVAFMKYLDFRYFNSGVDKVEWDNLLQIVKNIKGIKYVPDEYFFPRVDIATDKDKIIRLRGFLMLNLDGSVIADNSNSIYPVFYPNVADFSYQSTILRDL